MKKNRWRFLVILMFALPQKARAADAAAPKATVSEYVKITREIDVAEQDFRRSARAVSGLNTTANHFFNSAETKKKISAIHAEQTKLLAKLEGLYRRKRELAPKLEAKYVAWGKTNDYMEWVLSGQHSGNFGYLKRNRTIEQAENNAHCSVVVNDEPIYFESEEAFKDWVRRNSRGSVDKAIYHGQQDRYIRACLSNSAIPVGQSVKVSYISKDKCKDYYIVDSFRVSRVNAELVKRDGYVEVKSTMAIVYRGEPANKKKAIENLKNSLPEIEDFYASNGIKLTLVLDGDADDAGAGVELKDLYSNDQVIFLWDDLERQDSSNWASIKRAGVEMSKREQTLTHVHEIAHTLGAPDRYPDSDCPDRPVGPKESVMYYSAGVDDRGNYVDVRFVAGDIKAMLAPLCGD